MTSKVLVVHTVYLDLAVVAIGLKEAPIVLKSEHSPLLDVAAAGRDSEG